MKIVLTEKYLAELLEKKIEKERQEELKQQEVKLPKEENKKSKKGGGGVCGNAETLFI